MSRIILLAAVPLLVVFIVPAHASKFRTLYHFTDNTNGGDPLGGVVQDTSGTIYGETYAGGSYI